jgi:hypothetical protein
MVVCGAIKVPEQTRKAWVPTAADRRPEMNGVRLMDLRGLATGDRMGRLAAARETALLRLGWMVRGGPASKVHPEVAGRAPHIRISIVSMKNGDWKN